MASATSTRSESPEKALLAVTIPSEAILQVLVPERSGYVILLFGIKFCCVTVDVSVEAVLEITIAVELCHGLLFPGSQAL